MNYAPELTGVGRFAGELGAYLARRGHTVEVVTAPPHYPGWRTRAPYRAMRYSKELHGGATVFRCPIFLANDVSGLWRVAAAFSFAMLASPVVVWRILAGRPDVVLCVEPTLASVPAALFAAKLIGARTVLHVQDLEVDAAFAVGHVRNEALKRLALAVERFLVRRFDHVVTISERMREKLVDKGVLRAATTVIRNWVDLSRIRPLVGPNSFRSELRLRPDAFVLLYAGQIGAKQALPTLFEAVAGLDVDLVIAGDGPSKAALAAKYGAEPNVHFLPLQPENRLAELLSLADVHLLPQAAKASDLVLPSKLAGQLASGRRIVATAETGSELHALLSGVATLVPPGDAAALRAAIVALKNAPSAHDATTQLALAEQHFSDKKNLAAFERTILGGEQVEEALARAAAA